jgi:hypothetical protein
MKREVRRDNNLDYFREFKMERKKEGGIKYENIKEQ